MMLREYFRKRRMNKDVSGIPTGFLPLEDIHSVAVVVDGAGAGVDECVEMIQKFCKAHRMSVRLLYVDLRKFNYKFRPKTDPNKTIFRWNLNWYGLPNMLKVSRFVSGSADLFLCLYDSDIYCIQYISSVIKARFKVGLRDFPDDPYNFVVSPKQEVSKDKEPSPLDLENVFGKILALVESVR